MSVRQPTGFVPRGATRPAEPVKSKGDTPPPPPEREQDTQEVPWWEEPTTVGEFWSPASGIEHTATIVEEPRYISDNFGNRPLEIPTDQGLLRTGARDMQEAMKQARKRRNRSLEGCVLKFLCVGEKTERRFFNIRIE